MRVLIHEHFTSGGRGAGRRADGLVFADSRAAHEELLAAGQGMLLPLVADVLAAGAEVTVTHAPGLAIDLPGKAHRMTGHTPSAALAAALPLVDAALVIAPEADDALAAAALAVERAGVRNLGSSSDASRSVADKLLLSARLAASGVATPATAAGIGEAPRLLAAHEAIVVKPRRSAGCVDTFLCRHLAELRRLPLRDDWIAQERVPGLTASAAYVVTGDGVVPLRAGIQTIASIPCGSGGPMRLAYEGGRLPLDDALEARALAIGRAAIAQIRGLRGFVGVDVVLGADARDDRVIEINPRLTVAYAGLRALARFSIVELMLGRAPVEPGNRVWRSGGVRYDAAGNISTDA